MKYVYAAALALLLLLFLVFSAERESKKSSPFTANSYIEGVKIVHRKDGALSWVITAKRADLMKDEAVAQLDTVTIDAVSKGIVLNADAGTYNLETKALSLRDNIKMRIRDSVITVKDLAWDNASGMLTSNDEVTMESRRFRIEGVGLMATEDQKLKLMKNVRATFF